MDARCTEQQAVVCRIVYFHVQTTVQVLTKCGVSIPAAVTYDPSILDAIVHHTATVSYGDYVARWAVASPCVFEHVTLILSQWSGASVAV